MLNHLASWARIDFRPGHGQPKASRLVLAGLAPVRRARSETDGQPRVLSKAGIH